MKSNIRIEGSTHETSTFPGGEVHVKFQRLSLRVNVYANLKSSRDIMELLLLNDAVQRSGTKITKLTIPYFPYARQDRVCNEGEALSVKVMTNLINGMNIEKVVIIDPHSDVTPALLNNVTVIEQHSLLKGAAFADKLIVCPDAGAEKKIQKQKRPYVMATKVRDSRTGEIIETKILDPVRVSGKECLIVDDICDGGRTFIELGKALRKHNAKNVSLFVTHGIFSKGLDVFDGIIDQIFTIDDEGILTCV